jgi:hypothetical protein
MEGNARMKLLIPILLLFLIGCRSSFVPNQYENQLVITKKYYGQVLHTRQEKNYTLVVMQDCFCELVGQVIVPEGSHGYIRTVPVYVDVHPEIRERLQRKYFSWTGSEKEYKIKTW